jgi:hypothetical protein
MLGRVAQKSNGLVAWAVDPAEDGRGERFMAKTLTLAERQDAEGAWHQVIRDVCYGCGCRYLIAEDDHDLVWEPGVDRSTHCTDEECECHITPVIGERRW